MGQNNKIPSLRIAVTKDCNFKCHYCPPHGDSYKCNNKGILRKNDYLKIIDIAHLLGFKFFSITGGEPLIVPEITFALTKRINKYKNLGYLRLNTNGLLLKKYAQQLQTANFDKIKISLDTLNPKKHLQITNQSQSIKFILEGIEEMRKRKISLRIHTVVGKYNQNEIEEIITFCKNKGLDLKLFDLTYYKDIKSSNFSFWKENYVSLRDITKKLEKRYNKPKIINAIGGYGHNMKVFTTEMGTKIIIRNTEESAHYINECKKCPDYMCQDGFCNIVLSADGNLKFCRPKGLDFGLNLLNSKGKLIRDKEIRIKLQNAIILFKKAKKKTRTFNEMLSTWKK